MKTPPAWHEDARALRDEGLSYGSIAKRLCRPVSNVRCALDENGERQKRDESVKRFRKNQAAIAPAVKKPSPAPTVDTMAIARLFAFGQIDRHEMARRLRGETHA